MKISVSTHRVNIHEMRNADMMGQRNTEGNSEQRPTTSVTPINNGSASFRPQFTALQNRKRGIDSDLTYQIPEDSDTPEPQPELCTTRKRKGPASKTPNAKRRIGVQSRNIAQDGSDANTINPGQRYISKYEASSTKTRKNVSSQTTSSVPGQTGLFNNAPIQKAAIDTGATGGKDSRLSPMTSFHRGVVTTEDRLKSFPDRISLTTLSKLTSFRYQAVSSKPVKKDLSKRLVSIEADSGIVMFLEKDDCRFGTDDGHLPVCYDTIYEDESTIGIKSTRTLSSGMTSEQDGEQICNSKSFSSHGEDIRRDLRFQNHTNRIQEVLLAQAHPKLHDEPKSSTDLRMSDAVHSELQRVGAQSNNPVSVLGQRTLNSCSSDDEFGDHLDDGDFLTLISEVEARQPPLEPHKFPSSLNVLDVSRPAPHTLPISSQEIQQSVRSGLECGDIVCLSDDEEINSSDGDEYEALDLPLLMGDVTETFDPPSSVCRYSPADSRDREVYNDSLQYSPPDTPLATTRPDVSSTGIFTDLSNGLHVTKQTTMTSNNSTESLDDQNKAEWEFISTNTGELSRQNSSCGIDVRNQRTSMLKVTSSDYRPPPSFQSQGDSVKRPSHLSRPAPHLIDDEEYLYQSLKPFARPNFPTRIRDRSPIPGLTANKVLRVCFRIGEALQAGGQCDSTRQDAVIELYARLTFSSREEGTTKQHFQFRDLFYDRPPFLNGILENYKVGDLVNGESKTLIGQNAHGKMVRCLGKLKRDLRKKDWILKIDNVRETDWEEIQYTKQVLTEGWVKEDRVKQTV